MQGKKSTSSDRRPGLNCWGMSRQAAEERSASAVLREVLSKRGGRRGQQATGSLSAGSSLLVEPKMANAAFIPFRIVDFASPDTHMLAAAVGEVMEGLVQDENYTEGELYGCVVMAWLSNHGVGVSSCGEGVIMAWLCHHGVGV